MEPSKQISSTMNPKDSLSAPFRRNGSNPSISLSQIQNKELYIPLYIRDPVSGEFEVVSMPVNYRQLVELFYSEGEVNEEREVEKTVQSSIPSISRRDCETSLRGGSIPVDFSRRNVSPSLRSGSIPIDFSRTNVSPSLRGGLIPIDFSRVDNNLNPVLAQTSPTLSYGAKLSVQNNHNQNRKPNPRTLGISLNSSHGFVKSPSREQTIFVNTCKNPIHSPIKQRDNELASAAMLLPRCQLTADRTASYTDIVIRTFLQESCTESVSSVVSRNELQEAYQQWSLFRGTPHIAGSIMADYLNTLYKTTKIKKKVHYVGLQLN